VIRVYEDAGELIEVHRHKGDFKNCDRLIAPVVAVALGLVFAAYKHPEAYRVMFIFALPVLVLGGFLVLAIKIGDLNGSIKAVYYEWQHIQKDALSDQLAYQIRRLYDVRQFLKVFLIYYLSGFAHLVFLLFLRDLLDLAKDRHHTPT
jgi:MFS family permease